MADAALQAEVLKAFQPPTGPQGGPQTPLPPGTQANDTQGSGGGMMGTGSVPTPGMEGFSANTGTLPQ